MPRVCPLQRVKLVAARRASTLAAAVTHCCVRPLRTLAPICAGTTLALAGVMGQRANSSGKVMPAGIVAILSALMTCGYAKALA